MECRCSKHRLAERRPDPKCQLSDRKRTPLQGRHHPTSFLRSAAFGPVRHKKKPPKPVSGFDRFRFVTSLYDPSDRKTIMRSQFGTSHMCQAVTFLPTSGSSGQIASDLLSWTRCGSRPLTLAVFTSPAVAAPGPNTTSAVRIAKASRVLAAVALTKNTARIAWAMLRQGTDYNPQLAVA
jgi:hypothetical protein